MDVSGSRMRVSKQQGAASQEGYRGRLKSPQRDQYHAGKTRHGKSPMTRSKPLGPSFTSGKKHQREYGHWHAAPDPRVETSSDQNQISQTRVHGTRGRRRRWHDRFRLRFRLVIVVDPGIRARIPLRSRGSHGRSATVCCPVASTSLRGRFPARKIQAVPSASGCTRPWTGPWRLRGPDQELWRRREHGWCGRRPRASASHDGGNDRRSCFRRVPFESNRESTAVRSWAIWMPARCEHPAGETRLASQPSRVRRREANCRTWSKSRNRRVVHPEEPAPHRETMECPISSEVAWSNLCVAWRPSTGNATSKRRLRIHLTPSDPPPQVSTVRREAETTLIQMPLRLRFRLVNNWKCPSLALQACEQLKMPFACASGLW